MSQKTFQQNVSQWNFLRPVVPPSSCQPDNVQTERKWPLTRHRFCPITASDSLGDCWLCRLLLLRCFTSTETTWLIRDGERMGQGVRAQAHLPVYTAPVFWGSEVFAWCFTSTGTVQFIRDGGEEWDKE